MSWFTRWWTKCQLKPTLFCCCFFLIICPTFYFDAFFAICHARRITITSWWPTASSVKAVAKGYRLQRPKLSNSFWICNALQCRQEGKCLGSMEYYALWWVVVMTVVVMILVVRVLVVMMGTKYSSCSPSLLPYLYHPKSSWSYHQYRQRFWFIRVTAVENVTKHAAKQFFPLKTNIFPENWWLEDEISHWNGPLSRTCFFFFWGGVKATDNSIAYLFVLFDIFFVEWLPK